MNAPKPSPEWAHMSGKMGPKIPYCSFERCPAYDGKRCEIVGFQAPDVCEPAVVEIVRELQSLRSNRPAPNIP